MKANYKNAMKWWGIAFIIMAGVNVGTLLASYFNGNLKQLIDLPAESKTIVITILFAAFLILFLLELYLAVQAIRQSAGKYNGKAHIIIATIIGIIVTIVAIFNIVGYIKNTVSFTSCWMSAADVIIVFGYVECAKKLKKIK